MCSPPRPNATLLKARAMGFHVHAICARNMDLLSLPAWHQEAS
jgi:hypothetical protein